MSHLPTLIADLALILISASIITLLFKWLKQPLVLGYIVAGLLAGPYVHIFPTVGDIANINIFYHGNYRSYQYVADRLYGGISAGMGYYEFYFSGWNAVYVIHYYYYQGFR